jgi:hypothetical protein
MKRSKVDFIFIFIVVLAVSLVGAFVVGFYFPVVGKILLYVSCFSFLVIFGIMGFNENRRAKRV